jgi:trehalose utilization protein
VLGGALALTALAVWWQRRRDGAVRGGDDARERTTAAVLEGLGVRPGEADLTVVQFSTAFCGPCRATRARLQQLRPSRVPSRSR